MKRNEGDLDRALRAGLSVTALGTGIMAGGALTPVGIGLLTVGTAAGITAATGYCPLYDVVGISTVPAEQTATTASEDPRA